MCHKPARFCVVRQLLDKIYPRTTHSSHNVRIRSCHVPSDPVLLCPYSDPCRVTPENKCRLVLYLFQWRQVKIHTPRSDPAAAQPGPLCHFMGSFTWNWKYFIHPPKTSTYFFASGTKYLFLPSPSRAKWVQIYKTWSPESVRSWSHEHFPP